MDALPVAFTFSAAAIFTSLTILLYEKPCGTESGIILPDTANHQDGLIEGEVIAAGNGMYSANGNLIPLVVEVGDRILYGKHNSGQKYKLNGEDVIIMSQNEVLSILEDK